MTNEGNKAVVRKMFEAMETNDYTASKEVLAPNLKIYHFGTGEPLSREELLGALGMYAAAFSDQKYTVNDQLAEGDKVTTRTTWEATHSGEFQGLPPTGTRILTSGIDISRLENGQIVERWVEMNQLGLLQQLGLVPPS